MGQTCAGEATGDERSSHARDAKGALPKKGQRPNANRHSYELPSARRDKHQPAHSQLKDPESYRSENLADGKLIRLPGQVRDQNIAIADAKGSTFLLLDHLDSVSVDDCVDCTFYIGPTTGSVFIRGCKGCRVVALCGQLRLRDCVDTNIGLLCRSRPVIESSKNIGIGCFAGPQYLDLRWQLARAGISVWNNLFDNVHDFTPAANNWRLMTEAETVALLPSLTPLLPADSGISPDEERLANIVPWVRGREAHGGKPFDIVLCRAGFHDEAETLLHSLIEAEPGCVVETGEVRLRPDHVKEVVKCVPGLRGIVVEGNVHAVFTIACGTQTSRDLRELGRREGVLLVLAHDDGAADLREALLSREGAENGFGHALA